MKINNPLLSTLVLCSSVAQGQTPATTPFPTDAQAKKAFNDTIAATAANKKKITVNTKDIRSVWTATVDVGTNDKKAKLTVTRSDDNSTSNFTVKVSPTRRLR